MRFFFYGTLLDPDVTAVVLGRRLPPRAFVPAALPAHARRRAHGATYPVVVPDPHDEVSGAVVGGLSATDVARLSAFEGPGYRIAALRVRTSAGLTTVSVFGPIASRLRASPHPWDLVEWQRRHKRGFVGRLRRAFSGRRGCSMR
jgi:hypothetical protein